VQRRELPRRLERAIDLAGKPLEEQLADLWQRVLGRDHVGPQDNFFALGGDSLHAQTLIAGASGLGLRVTLEQLVVNPTPAELAAALGRDGGGVTNAAPEVTSPRFITLRSGSAQRRLVLFHPAGGSSMPYAPVARQLAGDVAVAGVESPELFCDVT